MLIAAPVETREVCALTTRGCGALPQVAAVDLDVSVIGQLAPPQLSLGYVLETGPLEMISLDAALGRE